MVLRIWYATAGTDRRLCCYQEIVDNFGLSFRSVCYDPTRIFLDRPVLKLGMMLCYYTQLCSWASPAMRKWLARLVLKWGMILLPARRLLWRGVVSATRAATSVFLKKVERKKEQKEQEKRKRTRKKETACPAIP